jgi:hypothetical protein
VTHASAALDAKLNRSMCSSTLGWSKRRMQEAKKIVIRKGYATLSIELIRAASA